MHLLRGHRRPVRAVAYAPGPAPLLASAGDDRHVHLWDPVAGQDRSHFQTPRDAVRSLAFSPDGLGLATGGSAGTLLLWDVDRQQQVGLSVGLSPVIAVAFTAGSRALLAGLRSQRYGGEPGKLVCWNLDPPHTPRDAGWVGEVESVAFCPARDLFAVGRLDRALEMWEVGRPRCDPVAWMPARVRALSFSADGQRLAVGYGRMMRIWNVEESRWLVTCPGHRADVAALAFSPDGTRLLSGSADRTARLWETHTGRQLGGWDWQVGPIHAVAVSQDGMTGACGGDKPTVVVWDLDEG